MKNQIVSMNDIEAIVNGVKKSGFEVMDDHNDGSRSIIAVAVYRRYTVDGELVVQKPVPMVDATYFSINPLYLNEGTVHIDRWSCGPVVEMWNLSLDEAVKKFNSTKWSIGRQEIEVLAKTKHK